MLIAKMGLPRRVLAGKVADPFRPLAKAGLLPVADLPQGLSGAAQGEIEGPSAAKMLPRGAQEFARWESG